jgi:hypothetical protein
MRSLALQLKVHMADAQPNSANLGALFVAAVMAELSVG